MIFNFLTIVATFLWTQSSFSISFLKYSLDMCHTMWFDKHQSQWTIPTFSGATIRFHQAAADQKEYSLHVLSIYDGTGTVSTLHALS